MRELRARDVSLVCLAGFMRLLGRTFLDAFPDAILNIHPSLLPSFPGVDAQRQAWEHGAKVAGATVHFVTGELDGGPIIVQSAVPILDDDTPETLAARILDAGAPDLSRGGGLRCSTAGGRSTAGVSSAPRLESRRGPGLT